MFDTLFNVFSAWNATALIVAGLVMLGLGSAFLYDFASWRFRGCKTTGKISAVRALGVREVRESMLKEGADDDVAARIASIAADAEKKSGEPEKPRKGPGFFIGMALMTLIPAIFVVIGFSQLYDYLFLKAEGLQARAAVVRYEESYDSDSGTSYFPVVAFEDDRGGRHELKSRMGGGSRPYEIGGSVPVIYEAGNAKHFMIDSFWPNVLFPSVFIGFGALFLVVIFWGVLFGKPTPPGDEPAQAGAPPAEAGTRKKDKGYAGEMYYAVIEYRDRQGELRQAETGAGSSLLSGKIPGDRLTVYARPDQPENVRTGSLGGLIVGLVFAGPGIALLWAAFSQFDFTPTTLLMIVGTIVYIGFRFKKNIKPRAEWDTRESFRARMREKTMKRRAQGVLLDRREVMRRLRRQDSQTLVWLPFLVLIACALMGGGWYVGRDIAALEQQGARAPGTVAELESVYSSSSDGGGNTYYPVVRFTAGSGGSIEFKSRFGSSPPAYKRGEKVTVLYDPRTPQNTAVIDLGWKNWLLPGGLFALGAMLMFSNLRSFLAIHARRAAAL